MTNFRPMLSGKAPADLAGLFPGTYLASPKLDGIRCVMINGVPHSRNLKPIPNDYIRACLHGLPDFDGELIVGEPTGNDVMNRTASGVMSRDGHPDFTYHVFDLWSHNAGFQHRIVKAGEWLRAGRISNRLKTVKHIIVSEPEHVKQFAERCVAQGYEGAMLRKIDGLYKFGRSTVKERGLLKIKFFEDAEATVVGCTELLHNVNEQTRDELGRAKRSKKKAGLQPTGKLGNLVCRYRGVQFEIGTGFDEQTRVDLWAHYLYHGKRTDMFHPVKFKFQGLTPDGVPRFPVFLGFRNEADMDAPQTKQKRKY